MIDSIESFFEVLRLDQGKDSSNVGILHPEQSLREFIWWQLRESPIDGTVQRQRIIVERAYVPSEIGW